MYRRYPFCLNLLLSRFARLAFCTSNRFWRSPRTRSRKIRSRRPKWGRWTGSCWKFLAHFSHRFLKTFSLINFKKKYIIKLELGGQRAKSSLHPCRSAWCRRGRTRWRVPDRPWTWRRTYCGPENWQNAWGDHWWADLVILIEGSEFAFKRCVYLRCSQCHVN